MTSAVAAPYFVGLFQYGNACTVIANITDQTDGDIENVLSVFNFDIDCMTEPRFADYYIAGMRSLNCVDVSVPVVTGSLMKDYQLDVYHDTITVYSHGVKIGATDIMSNLEEIITNDNL